MSEQQILTKLRQNGHSHGEFDYRVCLALDDVFPGAIVTPCGVRGSKMVVQLADAEDDALKDAPLYISKNRVDAPTPGEAITYAHEGVFLKWLVIRCDTSEAKLHDPVYLGSLGCRSFVPGKHEKRIGTVIHVGPASGPDAGAVLLEV